jgi:aminoglycoside phosphotransferase (APT) family kinase protein
MAVEQAWGRYRDVVVLSPTEASMLIGQNVLDVQPFSGGRRNSNYRLVVAGRAEPLVLRLHTADPSACTRERRLLELVKDSVPVPRIVCTAPLAVPPWSLMSFVGGERMDLALTTTSAATIRRITRSAGGALARIHQIRFSRAGFLDEQLQVRQSLGPEYRWHTFLHGMLGRDELVSNLGGELSDRLRRFVDDNRRLEEAMSAGGACLSHSDYKPWNLLVAGAEVAAVLDWEFAFAATPLNDVGNFLRYSARYVSDYETGFIEGYVEAGGSLPDDWRRLARLVDLISLLDFLARPDPTGIIVGDVRPLLEATLREYA